MIDFVKKMHESIAGIIKDQLKQVASAREQNTPVTNRLLDAEKLVAATGEILLYDTQSGETFINLGSNSQLAVGDKLIVFKQGVALKDPQSGEILGYTDEKITELIISEIRGPKLCLAVNNKRDVILGKGLKIKIQKPVR
ncbi:MAG: hypothetical protein HYV28_21285 [Ignavibacteriales bacterium]|nr:hypothetical protein [Ignavibacteriales bacterium]